MQLDKLSNFLVQLVCQFPVFTSERLQEGHCHTWNLC